MPRHMVHVTVNVPASVQNNLNNNELLNPYIFVRNRLYHFVFHRFCLLYVRLFSSVQRKLFEFLILVVSLFSFITLVYVHVVFVQTPITCLEGYRDIWQKNGILRVEVLSRKGRENYTLEDSYWKEKTLRLQQYDVQSYYIYSEQSAKEEKSEDVVEIVEASQDVMADEVFFGSYEVVENNTVNVSGMTKTVASEDNFQPISEASVLATDPDGAYIMEFSLEYGFLRLRPSKRRDLNISVTFVVLDPDVDRCFGGSFNKFLLDNFLGYDNILLASIKNMAEKKDQKGFVRNAVMEIEYIFINNWTNEKSYLTAGFVMMIFTLTISTLLRHSHHQIFVVVGSWLQHVLTAIIRRSNFFDVVWPRNLIPSSGAPVLTVILALVGMEAVMSDFFHDRAIALHVIVIVWSADVYDAVCCHSPLSKRHWFKFFYLYHFLFYAYNYKFSGVYWPLSLMTSWLFTLHSMIFFFHHYELPRFLHHLAQMRANRANQSPPQHDNAPDDSPPDNQEPPEESTDRPPNTNGEQSDNPATEGEGNETESSDRLPAADHLVTEGVVPASACDSLGPSAGVNQPLPKCHEDSHSLQIYDCCAGKEFSPVFFEDSRFCTSCLQKRESTGTSKCKIASSVNNELLACDLNHFVQCRFQNADPGKSLKDVIGVVTLLCKTNHCLGGREKILNASSDPFSWNTGSVQQSVK